VRHLLSGVLSRQPGIEIAGGAGNGREAIEATDLLLPDLITMDIEMPDMDGVEATRRIMQQRPTPILIVTAHADSPRLSIVFEAMRAGALDVIAKPPGAKSGVDPTWEQELLDKVTALAGLHPRPTAPRSRCV
jgi:two-component system chemotaxis response regulator CheB